DAAEITLAGDGAVEDSIADDDRILRHDAGILWRAHDEPTAGEALADVVVGFADQVEREAVRSPRPETLAGGPRQGGRNGVVGKPGIAVAARNLAGEHGADSAVGVVDLRFDLDRAAAFQCRPGLGDELLVEYSVELVVLLLAMEDGGVGRCGRLVEEARE